MSSILASRKELSPPPADGPQEGHLYNGTFFLLESKESKNLPEEGVQGVQGVQEVVVKEHSPEGVEGVQGVCIQGVQEVQEVVVCCHGIGSYHTCFGPLSSYLVDTGFAVLRYDLFGRGYSDYPGESSYAIVYVVLWYVRGICLCCAAPLLLLLLLLCCCCSLYTCFLTLLPTQPPPQRRPSQERRTWHS
jgi:pimeloyl-ACP methyl ester carboxylesterase